MLRLFVSAFTFLALTASAQALDARADIGGLLTRIQQDLKSTRLSDKELLSVRDQLQKIDRQLLGQGGVVDNRGGGRLSNLVCTSRDNDNQEPFQLAVNQPDFSVVKVAGAVLHRADCDQAVAKAVNLRGATLTCVSRDNDGQNPFSLVAIDQASASIQKINTFGNINDCFNALSTARRSQSAVEICGSRDNDGQSPYVHFVYSLQDKSIRTVGSVFNTIDQCRSGI